MTRNWGAIALRGVIAVLLGVIAVVWPGPTVGVLVILLGAFALVEGVTNVVAGVRGREGWAIAEGVISVVVGIVIVVWPAITALVLLYIVATWAIITGIVRIVAAIQLRRVVRNEWLLVGSGLASVIFGVIAAVFPGAGILAFTAPTATHAASKLPPTPPGMADRALPSTGNRRLRNGRLMPTRI